MNLPLQSIQLTYGNKDIATDFLYRISFTVVNSVATTEIEAKIKNFQMVQAYLAVFDLIEKQQIFALKKGVEVLKQYVSFLNPDTTLNKEYVFLVDQVFNTHPTLHTNECIVKNIKVDYIEQKTVITKCEFSVVPNNQTIPFEEGVL